MVICLIIFICFFIVKSGFLDELFKMEIYSILKIFVVCLIMFKCLFVIGLNVLGIMVILLFIFMFFEI